MGQKIHPVGLRLGITTGCRERWLVRSSKTRQRWVVQDKAIRDYLHKNFKEAYIKDILLLRQDPNSIDRNDGKPVNVIDVKIISGDPVVIKAEQVENKLEKALAKVCLESRIPGMWPKRPEFRIFIHHLRLKNPDHHAARIADDIIEDIENRIPFRKALKGIVNGLQVKGKKRKPRKAGDPVELKCLQGVRIQLSGRLNGAEIARVEWFKQGRVPLQTLRAKIDYVSKTAKTTQGMLGIKVWTFRGEMKPN